MLFSQPIIDKIADISYKADKAVRFDLINENIADENDYTSNLTQQIRDQITSSKPDLTDWHIEQNEVLE